MRRKFGIDIDGVIADWNRAFYHTLVGVSGRDLGMTRCGDSWHWARLTGYTVEEEQAARIILKNDPLWWEDVMPTEEAEEFLEWLQNSADDEVYFITHRHGVNIKQQTETWLELYGVNRPTVLLAGTGPDNRPTKGLVVAGLGLTHFLDDSGYNCKQVKEQSPFTQVFCLSYKHNESMHDELRTLGVVVVDSLADFRKAVSVDRC